MNEKEKQKGESRIEILRAAAKLFRTKGFTATGIDELMKEAGLTAGAFYAHFASKQDLFDHTLAHMLKSSAGRFTKGIQLENNKNLVSEMLKRYVTEAHRDYPEHGCAIPAIASEIARHSKHGKAIVGEYVGRWAALFEKNLEGGKKVRREEALRLISQAIGSVLLSRLVPEELSEEILSAVGKR